MVRRCVKDGSWGKMEVEKVVGLRPLEERFALGWRQKIK